MAAMDSIPASCRAFLLIVRDLIGCVRADASVRGALVAVAPRAMARRLAAGLRLVEACLRRLLLVMALEFEPMLVERRGPLGRPHGRTAPAGQGRRFAVLDSRSGTASRKGLEALKALAEGRRRGKADAGPALVGVAALNQRLERLAAIAADPVARARRLAFHLARSRPGPIRAPALAMRQPAHLRRHWSPGASLMASAMALTIYIQSRARPPPLPPRRWHGPSITVLG